MRTWTSILGCKAQHVYEVFIIFRLVQNLSRMVRDGPRTIPNPLNKYKMHSVILLFVLVIHVFIITAY